MSTLESDDTRARDVEAARAAMQAAQPRDPATRLQYNYEELVSQPAAIRETLAAEQERIAALAEVVTARVKRKIYGIGCGDSWATTQAVGEAYERLLDLPFEPQQALEFTRFGLRFVGEGDVVIGLSASGTTAETIKGLRAAREAGALTIGVTNSASSPFTSVPESYILGRAIRRASFPTQASTVGLAALLALAGEVARLQGKHPELVDELDRWLEALPALVEEIIAAADPLARELAGQWVERRVFTFVGAGPGLAAAMFGAAKIREGCEGYGWIIGTEEFHHYEIVQPGDPVFLVAPRDEAHFRAIDVARAVREAGGILYSVVPEDETEVAALSAVVFRIPRCPNHLIALPYTIPLQLAAWHISLAKL